MRQRTADSVSGQMATVQNHAVIGPPNLSLQIDFTPCAKVQLMIQHKELGFDFAAMSANCVVDV